VSAPTDAEKIAAGLTKAQRRAILGAEPDGQLGNLFIRGVGASKAVHESGLTTIVWSGLMLNSLGLEVRKILEREA
jgi:hypothetical protein